MSVRPSVRRSARPSVPCYFQTRTRRILCRVSGLVILDSAAADFRRPESPRLSRLHQVAPTTRRESRPTPTQPRHHRPTDAGVTMGTRSNLAQQRASSDGLKGARLRSKSSSRVLEASSESGQLGGFTVSFGCYVRWICWLVTVRMVILMVLFVSTVAERVCSRLIIWTADSCRYKW